MENVERAQLQRRCSEVLARLISEGGAHLSQSTALRRLLEEQLPSLEGACLKVGSQVIPLWCGEEEGPCATCLLRVEETRLRAFPIATRETLEGELRLKISEEWTADLMLRGQVVATTLGHALFLRDFLARRFGELKADFNALVEATRAISMCQDLDDLYEVVAQQGHRLLNLKPQHSLTLMRHSAFDKELILVAASGQGVESWVGLRLSTDPERAARMFFPRYEDNRLAKGLPRQVDQLPLTVDLVLSKAPWLLVDDVEARDPGEPYYHLNAKTRSEIAVPIVLDEGAVWGVLNVESPNPHNFSPIFDLPVLQSFARVVGVFVQSLARRDGRQTLDALISLPDSLKRVIHLSAQSDEPVLITGETGTGKEVVARALHSAGPRRKAAFIPVNCGAIEQGLLMNELFGHGAHSYTGAGSREKGGLFHAAHQGTIFLDEIENMPMSVQEAVLRVVERGEVRRVGETQIETVNVRIIAATNQELREKISRGTFRLDLYYRLKILEITLPPLRERVGTIPRLVEQLIGELRRPMQEVHVEPGLMEVLVRYPWPGNVRELKNAIKRMLVFSNHLTVDILPEDILQAMREEGQEPQVVVAPVQASPAGVANPANHTLSFDLKPGDTGLLERAERRFIVEALRLCRGDRYAAAHLLGISPPTIYRKIKSHGINETSDFQ